MKKSIAPNSFCRLKPNLALTVREGSRKAAPGLRLPCGALAAAILTLSVSLGVGASLVWIEQGPRPMTNLEGGTGGITSPEGNNPGVGSLSAVAQLKDTPFYTGNPDIIYVAASNGGLWKTTNGTAVSPSWTPLSDQGQFNGGGLPVGMSLQTVEISPLAPTTIFVGASRNSAFAQQGAVPFGIGRSTDGGVTWTVVDLSGLEVRSVVPTQVTVNDQQVVLAGAMENISGGAGGVYRSTDGGDSYALVTSGIPATAVTDLVGDPGVPTRFYAATREGKIYISNDTGATWTEVSTGAGFTVVNGARVLLSVHNSPGNDVVYAMVIGTNNKLSAVYRSADQGANWVNLGTSTGDIFPGSQGSIHGAIEADPADANTVYLGGDDGPRLIRNVSGTWDILDQAFTNGTKPHGDARDLDFDPAGNILRTDDGGIFKLNSPNTPGLFWSSLNGTNMGATEVREAAWDSFSDVAFASMQDAAVHLQRSPGFPIWDEMGGSENNHILVDADQAAHPGNSIRYIGGRLPEQRMTYNAANTLVGSESIQYNITSGSGNGQTIFDFDADLNGFNGNAILNRLNPARMLLTGTYIYESLDKGDTVANLGPIGPGAGGGATRLFSNRPITYGGLNGDGTPNPGSFYVGGNDNKIYHRANASAPIVVIANPTWPEIDGYILAIVSDPKDVSHVFVLSSNGRIWGSLDEGATWQNLTDDLVTLTRTSYLRTIEMIPSASGSTLLAGGLGGVWQLSNPGAGGSGWSPLGTSLPQGLVYDVRYDDTDNLMVAGILGRGVWTLQLSSVNLTPTNIVMAVNGPNLNLSWPADHTGWRLLEQTNQLASGISTNLNDWATVSGSACTNSVTILIDPAKPTTFYRLTYP